MKWFKSKEQKARELELEKWGEEYKDNDGNYRCPFYLMMIKEGIIYPDDFQCKVKFKEPYSLSWHIHQCHSGEYGY